MKAVNTISFPTIYSENLELTTYRTRYKDQPNMKYVMAIHSKEIPEVPIIRIHSSCLLSETFGSTHCDCAEQLHESLKTITEKGGIVFYLDQEGRGHGIIKKMEELELQQVHQLDTVEASKALGLTVDERKFNVIADILSSMKIKRVKILTNNPRKVESLKKEGINIVETIPLEIVPNVHSYSYLKAKKNKLGHMLKKYVRD